MGWKSPWNLPPFKGEYFLVTCSFCIWTAKVVSTHLWNTPRYKGIPFIIGERGIAWGVLWGCVGEQQIKRVYICVIFLSWDAMDWESSIYLAILGIAWEGPKVREQWISTPWHPKTRDIQSDSYRWFYLLSQWLTFKLLGIIYIYFPYAPCMVYLPTFTIKINQM